MLKNYGDAATVDPPLMPQMLHMQSGLHELLASLCHDDWESAKSMPFQAVVVIGCTTEL